MHKTEFVFAYGSNMDPSQMRERCPESDLSWFIAKAPRWRLCFPRCSIKRKGGVGSLIRDDESSVWGVVFSVTKRDLTRLDRFEGVRSRSNERKPIEVIDEAGRTHQVETYFAKPADHPPREYVPSRGYLALYIRGAEYFGLPKSYIQQLREIKTNGQEL